MSVTHSVFLLRKRLPTAAQLNAALKEASIDLQLDSEWNTGRDSGFWPAKFQGCDAGFEWLVESTADADIEKHVRSRVAKSDLLVSLVTRSDPNQLASAVAVWGVLASITDGMAYADESGDFFEPGHALELAHEQVAEPPQPKQSEPQITYPREIHEPLAVTETRRTSHSLSLEGLHGHYLVFLETRAIPSPAAFVVSRQLEHRKGELSVLELEVNRRFIRFTPNGRVLDPEYLPDYSALVLKLGDTESVGMAFRKGGEASAPVLATFIRNDAADVARRRLAIVTLGLMGVEATRQIDALRSLEGHPVLGGEAVQAIKRIEAAAPKRTSPANR